MARSRACQCAHPGRRQISLPGALVTPATLDLDRLLKLRLVVARFGELDAARWWNTKGQLGPLGSKALQRGFPRTHYFAQTRSVFAVAAARCREVFAPPGCVTLWELDEATEQEFDARWEAWLDDASSWTPFFERLAAPPGPDLAAVLRGQDLVRPGALARAAHLRRAAEGRSVLLPSVYARTDEDVELLALGFSRGEVGALAVPYQRRSER